MLADQPLTIAQACRVLGVSERTLRRILRDPEMQAQILAEHRRTATGLRRSSLLPPHLIETIKRGALPEDKHAQNIQADTSRTPESSVLAYERLLAEQAARIADLQSALAIERGRVAQLTADVEEARQALLAARNKKPDVPESVWQRVRGRRS